MALDRTDNHYRLALVTDDRVEWQPLRPAPPLLNYPTWNAAAGRHWLYGYSGLYEQTTAPTGDWHQVTAFPDTGFGASLISSNEAVFTFSGGPSGHPGCSLFSGNGWTTVPGDFSQPKFGWDKKTIYLSSHGGVFIRKEPGTLDLEYLQAPGDSLVNVTVADPAGNLWLGASEGVLRYQPSRIPPVTKILASSTEVRKGLPLPVMFRGLRRFGKENNPASFRYSWRVDNGHLVELRFLAEANFAVAGTEFRRPPVGGAGARHGRQRECESGDLVFHRFAGAAPATSLVHAGCFAAGGVDGLAGLGRH